VRFPTPSIVLRAVFRPSEDRSIEGQAVRQLLAGLAATLADLSIFRLSLALGLHPMWCAVSSFAASVTVNFFLTRVYAIGEPERQDRGIAVQYAAYVATGLVSLAIVQLMLGVFHLRMGFKPFNVKLASVPVVFVWTVLSSRFLVFTKRPLPLDAALSDAFPFPVGESEQQRSEPMPEPLPQESSSGPSASTAPVLAAQGEAGDGKWPKRVPVLTPEQVAIRDDFMRDHLEAMETKWYGFVTGFDNRYPLKSFFPGCRTLEIGAGLGEHINWERHSAQEYHALDLRQELCDRIRERFPDVDAFVGDCQERLPFDDGYFDRIVAIHVLEHLPDLPRALAEFRRLLKPGGVLSAVIPCEGAWAHRLARRISEKPRFERKYHQSYNWLIRSEHLSRPKEIMGQLTRFFELKSSRYYPLFLPIININLTIGLTLVKKVADDGVQ
jgi:ubiquinone/menaquinone biosynthesis C-methylase UbiE/putative flippase GtrA